jgi:diguanylate cyclase (GGDEF)-like protein
MPSAAPVAPVTITLTPAVTAITAVAALAATYTAGSILHWGAPSIPSASADAGTSHTLADIMGDFGLTMVAAAAAVSCTARAFTLHGRPRASWLLFAASALVAGLGNAVWGWYEIVLHRQPPSPSIADWVFLFFAPFAMAGTLVHLRGPGTVLGWLKLLLDGLMIAGALFTAGWGVALAKDAGEDGSSPLHIALGLAYPVFDILLVSLVIAVRSRGGRRDGASMATLVVGYSIVVAADAIWSVPSVRSGYTSGELLDSGWFGGYLLLAVAPWMSLWTRDATRHKAPRSIAVTIAAGIRRTLSLIGLLFPYAAGTICLAGILVDGFTGDHRVHPALLAAGGAVLVALVIRQGVTLLDNLRLTRELSVREDHFRTLVQGSSDVIMTVDPEGLLGYISPAIRHVFGYEPEDLAATSLYRLVHPDDREPSAHAIRLFLGGSAVSASVMCRIRAAQPLTPGTGAVSVPGTGTVAGAGAGAGAGTVTATGSSTGVSTVTALWRHAECTLTRHRGGLVFTCRDVSDRVALQQQLAYNAYHDSLTGLPNRALFADRLEQAVAITATATAATPATAPATAAQDADAPSAHPVAVVFLDLDWFKEVNDVGGHAVGDALLTEVAARLRGSVRAGDTVARFGGDEFAALVHCGPDGSAARDVAARLLASLTRPYELSAGTFVIGASIGVAYSRAGASAAELMREADLAMYEAKARGKGRVAVREPAPLPAGRPVT